MGVGVSSERNSVCISSLLLQNNLPVIASLEVFYIGFLLQTSGLGLWTREKCSYLCFFLLSVTFEAALL